MALCSNCKERKVKAKGLCANCYMRLKRRGTLEYKIPDNTKPCTNCGKGTIHAQGLCSSCYQRYLLRGSPEKIKVKKIQECECCRNVRPIVAKGLCGACYQRLRMKGTTDYRIPEKSKPCTFCGEHNVKAKGLCDSCYQRFRKSGSLEYQIKGKPEKICSMPGCDKKATARELCNTHYQRWLRHRDPYRGRPPKWGDALKHPDYKLWIGMKQRCSNPKREDYHRYGGRGIKFCERWDDFWNFIYDMGERPTPEYTIERINNDGDYEPSNCKWKLPKDQARNRTNTVLTQRKADKIRYFYKEGMSVREIADKMNLHYDNVYSVIQYNTWK